MFSFLFLVYFHSKQISCKSGYNLDHLKRFLNLLPVRNQSFYPKQSSTSTAEFLIHTTFKNGDLIILGGCVTKGILKKHQYMYLGPDSEGFFK